jgi:hypothetical protein
MQSVPQLLGRVLGPLAGPVAIDRDDADRGGADEPGETNQLPPTHAPTVRPVSVTRIGLDEAASITRSGDIWLFTGRKLADRAIRAATNSPVNHVGVVLAIDDLPPLLWHAELGQSSIDVWTGKRQRGAQLHRLTEAASTWVNKYGQRAYFRQLDPIATPDMENSALAVVAELSGTRFPTTLRLMSRWIRGRARRAVSLEDIYCAEVVALTYQRMGLLDRERPVNWYDPGKFWSGDRLELVGGATLGPEIAVDVPLPTP